MRDCVTPRGCVPQHRDRSWRQVGWAAVARRLIAVAALGVAVSLGSPGGPPAPEAAAPADPRPTAAQPPAAATGLPARADPAGGTVRGAPPPDAAEADYDFASRATPNPVAPGGLVILKMTLTYRPQSTQPPVNGTNVRVTDTLPPELVYIAAAPNPDYSCTTPPVGTHGPIACTRFADITPGTVDIFEVVVRATACWSGPAEIVTTVTFETVSAPSVNRTASTPPRGLVLYCSADAATAPTAAPASAAPPTAPLGSPGNLTVVPPVRVVDTRPTGGRVVHVGFQPDGQPSPAASLPGGNPANPESAIRRFLVAGRSFAGTTIPATATALMINVTAFRTGGSDGYVTVFSGDGTLPSVPTVTPAGPVSTAFWATRVAPPGGAYPGTIAAFSTDPVDLAIDVVGYLQ